MSIQEVACSAEVQLVSNSRHRIEIMIVVILKVASHYFRGPMAKKNFIQQLVEITLLIHFYGVPKLIPIKFLLTLRSQTVSQKP